jgi:predicted nucleic acid-binding protein
MDNLFVDTDVILDLFVRREPHHKTALRFFSFLKMHAIAGFTSPVSVANTYYILAKIRDRRYALAKIRRLTRLIRIATIDQAIIEAAIQVPYKDFEDSIQYNCAVSNGLKNLITRNVSDYPRGQLQVLLPDEYMTIRDVNQ